jgi:hypothetical protein
MGENIVYDKESNRIGYVGHFTGAYICDTCGAYCECNEGDEEGGEK